VRIETLRRRYVEGRDISDVEVLVGVAEGAGLPGEAARRVLDERSFRGGVDQDWLRSRLIGVTGVPTFVASGRAVVGAQPYEVLEELVVRAGAEPAG
jgi:predicted DsbA family dithiol-disulfide isomerase